MSSAAPPCRIGWRLICQLARAAVSRRPRAASRSPALPPAGSRRSASDGAARQGQRRRDHHHRVDAEVAVRPGRDRRVVPQLPARQHGQQRSGPGRRRPGSPRRWPPGGPGGPAPCRGDRAQRRDQHDHHPAGRDRRRRPARRPRSARTRCPAPEASSRASSTPSPPPAAADSTHSGTASAAVMAEQLPAGRAARGEHGRLALALARRAAARRPAGPLRRAGTAARRRWPAASGPRPGRWPCRRAPRAGWC